MIHFRTSAYRWTYIWFVCVDSYNAVVRALVLECVVSFNLLQLIGTTFRRVICDNSPLALAAAAPSEAVCRTRCAYACLVPNSLRQRQALKALRTERFCLSYVLVRSCKSNIFFTRKFVFPAFFAHFMYASSAM